ncbi:MAG TPA: PAS domain-containing protein [Terriglobales bacterium]|nr:PAS domain-containing protein [Terriglobales bacterium]
MKSALPQNSFVVESQKGTSVRMRWFFTKDPGISAIQFLGERSLGGVLLRAAFAVVLTAVSLWITLKLPPYQTQISYSFFTAAVAASAYFAGWRAGLLTTVLTSLVIAWVLPPLNSLAIADHGDAIRFMAFVFTAVVICLIIASLHRSRRALRDTRDALRLSKRRIAYVERHAKVWTWEYDVRTDRVSWSNLYGNTVSRREQSLRDWLQMVHEEDREQVADAIRRAVQKGEFEARFRIMLGDSQPRWLLGRAQLVLLDGQPAALVGINMDASVHGDSNPVGAPAPALSIR